MKQTNDGTSFKTVRVSLKNLIKGILAGILILFVLLVIEENLAYAPLYIDANPRWTPDGRYAVFTRWFPRQQKCESRIEVFKIDPASNSRELLYKTDPGFFTYQVIKMVLSQDSKHLTIRMNKHLYNSKEIQDTLIRIPLADTSPPVLWELEKNNRYDIFLAFRDDRVLVRRQVSGDSDKYFLEEYSFPERKLLRVINTPDNLSCISADYIGDSTDLAGLLARRINLDAVVPDTREVSLFDFRTGKLLGTTRYRTHIIPLETRNTILQMTVKDRNISITEHNTLQSTFRKIIDKRTDTDEILWRKSPDESAIYLAVGGTISRVDLETLRETVVLDTFEALDDIDINRKTGEILFDDSRVIGIFLPASNNIRMLTQVSPRIYLERFPIYRRYSRFREKMLMGGH